METFSFLQNYQLENERVRLKPLQVEDFEALLPFAIAEPELWKYSLVSAAGAENMRRYIQAATLARQDQKEYPFLVFDKKLNSVAGSTRFYDIQLHHHTVQLGFTWYGKEFQGTGLNRHCKFLMLDFAFGRMGFERVEFRADLRNAKSIQAMKRIGCVQEGVLRRNCADAQGGRRDSIILSILKNEWEDNLRDNLLQQLKS